VFDIKSTSMSFNGFCLRGEAVEVRPTRGTQDSHNQKPYITGRPS
jgi:hypothetical protein